jgi:CheY-like chemotaxis protein
MGAVGVDEGPIVERDVVTVGTDQPPQPYPSRSCLLTLFAQDSHALPTVGASLPTHSPRPHESHYVYRKKRTVVVEPGGFLRYGRTEEGRMTHIAVVNDDTVFLDMMAAVLRERAWDVSVCREGDNAFEQLRDDPPDVIILDIRMETPETGWTILELLTLDQRTAAIPVIVCSAAIIDLRAHESLLKKYGIAVLPKPFNVDALYAEVDRALAGRRQPR